MKITYSIKKSNNGYSEIYLPQENGEYFSKTTTYDRHLVSFKTRKGAEKFLLRQGAKSEEIQ